MKDKQKLDKILGFTLLHKIGLHTPYTNLNIRSQISRILTKNFGFNHSFILATKEILRPIYRLYKIRFSEYN